VEQITTTKVAEYSPTEAALAKLRTEFAGAKYDVTTKDGNAAARKARHQLRSLRTALEDKRKEIKAPILVQAKLIDDEAKRITAEIVALEDPIDSQITAHEAAEEAKRAAALKAEQERVAVIEKRIADMERLPATLVGKSGVDLGLALDTLRAASPAAWAQEFLPKATAAHQAAIDLVQKMWSATVWQETEAKRLAEEKAELERKQAEARAVEEKAKAEREAAEEASRLRIEEQERAARLAREEADRQAREQLEAEKRAAAAELAKKEAALKAQQDKLDAERRAKEEAEHQAKLQAEREAEAKARAERERIAAEEEQARQAKLAEEERRRQEKLALEQRQREEQEAREAAEREERRKAAELVDAEAHLQAFVDRFGHLTKFGWITDKIKHYLREPAKAA
jgi:colicin import membrane protein